MAGQSVGTIFVELDLDPSRYTKGQQQLLKDATSTTLNIEENFKKLGIKSSAEMDLMRAKITNSFDMIANSSKATANDIMRAEEAKNAKLNALNEQQFGKQTSLLTNIKSHWMAYSAAAYGALALIEKGWAMAEAAAGYIEQMQLLEGLAQKYNTSATTIVAKIREIGEGMISMATASQIGLSGLAKGLNPDMMYGLAKAAVVLSDVMGVNANEAFIRLSESLEANKTKGLKLAIGVIDLKDKYGELADKMSESEKQVALYNMIMEKTAEIQAQTGQSTKSLADQMDTLKTRIADLRIEIGIYLMKAGAGVIGLFEGMYSAGLMVTAGIWKLNEAYQRLQAVFSWGDVKKSLLNEAAISASMAAENFDKSGKAATNAQKNFKLMLASTEDLIKAEKTRSSAINTTTESVGKRESAEKKAAEEAKKREEAEKKALASMKTAGDEIAKSFERWNKEADEAGKEFLAWQDEEKDILALMKTGADEAAKAFDDLTKQAAEEGGVFMELQQQEEQAITDRTAAFNQMYADLKGKAETYYDFMKENLEKQAADYAKMTGDKVMAEAWLNERLIQLNIEKGKSSDSFIGGVKAGFLGMKNSLYTWGQAGYDMFKTLTGAMSSTFSSVFKDAIAGHLKSFGDYFKSFWDTMLNKFVDIMAQMLTEWLVLQAAMKTSQWLGFGTIGGGQQATGGDKASMVGQQVGMNVASSALYAKIFGTGAGVGLFSGGTSAAATYEASQAAFFASGGLDIGAPAATSSGMGATVAAYAVPVAAALAVQQLIQNGPDWLYAAMGGEGETRDQSLMRKMLMYPGEYSTTPLTAEQIGAPAFSLNPVEMAQYQADLIAQSILGTDYLKQLMMSPLYAQMAANPPAGYNSWEEYGNYTSSLPTMHDGGIIRAHKGLYLAPDERLLIGQTGERVLNREQTKTYDSGGNGGEITIHNHLYIDGKEVSDTIVRGIRAGDDDLIKYIRRAAN